MRLCCGAVRASIEALPIRSNIVFEGSFIKFRFIPNNSLRNGFVGYCEEDAYFYVDNGDEFALFNEIYMLPITSINAPLSSISTQCNISTRGIRIVANGVLHNGTN